MRNALTQIKVKNAGDGKLEDGGGLRLVKKNGVGKWVYRYSHLGKRREMGLGGWPTISLAGARKIRDEWSAVLAAGRDPISVRRKQQDAAKAEMDREDPTFAELVDIVFEARKDTLRGGGSRGRWLSPLNLYMIPAFGKKRCSDLSATDVYDALKPIWRSKHPTALKAVRRTDIVLRSAKRMSYPCDPSIVESARERLGIVRHVEKPIPAVPWQELPALYQKLGDTTSGLCNRWIMLTLVRMEAARAARVSEVDGDVWTVPEDRVKGQEGLVTDFRVPLSTPALELVERARELDQDLLFAGPRGAPITNAAVEKCLRTLKAPGTPHGMRSSFRMWVQDTDPRSFEEAETVLGHVVGRKVERTYARSDLLDRRRVLMQRWADFITGESATVVKLRASN